VWPQLDCTGRKIGYARVSTKDQKLRMQRDALEAIGCDTVYEDHGVSGSHASRPGLDGMLDELTAGDMVIVFKLDRLGRSVLNLADLLVRFRNEGIHFCSICEGINTNTSGGKLIYHLFSAFAEFQRDIMIENTIEGMNAARRRGARIGRPPILTPDASLEEHRCDTKERLPKELIAERCGVSRITLDRAFHRIRQGAPHAEFEK